jgi:hypothetical protein
MKTSTAKRGRPKGSKFTPEQRKERARIACREFRASNAAYRERQAALKQKRHSEQYVQKKQTAEWQEASRLRKLSRAPKGTKRLQFPDPYSSRSHPLEYSSYNCAKRRCTDPARAGYLSYGGRGISFSQRWLGPGGFQRFLSDVGKRPSKAHTLHRKHNDGNYEKGNVAWSIDHMERNLTWMLTKSEKRALLASIPPYRAKVA